MRPNWKREHFPRLENSKSQINKAGKILSRSEPRSVEWESYIDVVNNWRLCHGYPVNTFQATLRKKLNTIDPGAIVSQRIKRIPTISNKLLREPTMKLANMQDIGGLRAVCGSVDEVYDLRNSYLMSDNRFKHKLYKEYDYIKNPKSSGYRSIHLVYEYINNYNSDYNGLKVELQ